MGHLKRSLLNGLAVAAALATGIGAASAQDTATDTDAAEAPATEQRLVNGTRFGAWQLRCEAVAVNETNCVLSQRIVQRESNRFLAELLLILAPDDPDRSLLAARVPVGVYFPSGFVMRIGETETRYEFAWQSCDREQCEALQVLTVEDEAALEAAPPGVIGYRPRVGAEPLVFQVATSGAKAGLDALRAAR